MQHPKSRKTSNPNEKKYNKTEHASMKQWTVSHSLKLNPAQIPRKKKKKKSREQAYVQCIIEQGEQWKEHQNQAAGLWSVYSIWHLPTSTDVSSWCNTTTTRQAQGKRTIKYAL